VLAAVADAGLDPEAAALDDPQIKRALREATEGAHARGVFGVPTVAVGDQLFWGDDRLEEAAAANRDFARPSSQARTDVRR
jgi:2-hydroxychromene-2-carboxylate isomerase